MADIFQNASWPGVLAVESCEYVCSHGVSPGRAVMVSYPQAAAPAEFGNLVFSDGRRAVAIRGCKVDRVTPQWTPDGITYTIEILDERWQWVGKGGVTGHYNAKDRRGKLVPWTIRSPQELAAICFKALGVANGEVVLPPGLGRAAGEDEDDYLQTGVNYPQSLTNPEVIWDHTPPAEALAQLAELWGCRVIYQPAAARVLVAPLGRGAPFPALPYEVIGATIDATPAPAAVAVFGSPIKYQLRFLLEAVGEEWDGTYLPLDQLSYAPQVGQKRPQISQVRSLSSVTVQPLTVTLSFIPPGASERATYIVTDSAPAVTVADRLTGVAAKLNAEPAVKANFWVRFDGSTKLLVTSKDTQTFTLAAVNPANPNDPSFVAENVQAALNAVGASWASENPYELRGVQPTERLSYTEARNLALGSVWRTYRILNWDPETPYGELPGPYELPGIGVIRRRQQFVLQTTKVEQVAPQPRIPGAVNRGALIVGDPPGAGFGKLRNLLAAAGVPGQGVLPNYYDGFSRDQANTVTGSVALRVGSASVVSTLFFTVDNDKERYNTEPHSRVFVDFEIDAERQLIRFAEPVYYSQVLAGGMVQTLEPRLTLECGVYILHPETNQPYRWEELLPIAGGVAPVEWSYREDVRVGIIGRYDDHNALYDWEYLDREDARARAGYYLRGMASKYQLKGGETRQYVGIVPHDPDGYCQQVTWKVGAGGATTVVSGNTEHHPMIAPYPERRRAENLSPDKAAAAANAAERELIRQWLPASR